MTRLVIAILTVLATATAVRAQSEDSPHRMLKPDGEVDNTKCAVCHNPDDLSLLNSKLETCTLCHSMRVHACSAIHVGFDAAAVAATLPAKGEGVPELPLTDEGRIYCGTCHIFHDPRISEEKSYPPWLPQTTGVGGAVRAAMNADFDKLSREAGATEPGAKFMGRGTRQMRLPINDGTLCRHCHRSGGR